MSDEKDTYSFASDMVLLKQIGIHPIVVHGGGPQIGNMLEKVNVTSKFEDGLRVTDKETMDVAEMVLCGPVNNSIVTQINLAGGKAVGLSGKDANLLTVEKVTRKTKTEGSNVESIVDLGFVGEPKKVDTSVLEVLTAGGIIPVIAPVAIGEMVILIMLMLIQLLGLLLLLSVQKD